jgi:hypothetical protein
MTAGMASRPAEEEALGEFLAAATISPSALMVDGEAGIGKTTVWLAGLEQAREHGFRVLSARALSAESVLAYASLADLLTDVDRDTWADLPEPQRIAVDRVLLREQTANGVTDQRAVTAAFLSVVAELAASGMTNRDVATKLYISAKTVEATLARIYRKLDVRSRAELGTRVNTIRD